MRRLAALLAATCLAALILAAPVRAAFGVHDFDLTFTNSDGTMATQAGSHPFAMTVSFAANVDGEGDPEGWFRNLTVKQILGLVGDTTAYPRCTSQQFLIKNDQVTGCPVGSVVGVVAVAANEAGSWRLFPVHTIDPPPGVLLRLGFSVSGSHVVTDVRLNTAPPYNVIATARNIPQTIDFLDSKLQLWGDPSDSDHDELRGPCAISSVSPGPGEDFAFKGHGEFCPVEPNPRPFLTLPTTCAKPLLTTYEAISWPNGQGQSEEDSGGILTHDAGGNPEPLFGCGALPPFSPSLTATPTSRAAHSPTGLDVSLDVDDEGLTSVDGLAQSDIRKSVVTLPQGMTANPSLAEGLEVCSERQLAEESLEAPDRGCPEAAKIGTIEVQTPLLNQALGGSLFVAKPFENLADDSLIAVYIVIKDPGLGILVKQTMKVVPDPGTGQLVAIVDEIPQLPLGHVNVHLREGGRSPLVSPSLCGRYETKAEFTPWSDGPAAISTSTFTIVSGPNEGPCPAGAMPPFEPGFQAGSQNNAAGAYSPFSMRLTRRDGDQDLTRFDATLPPGVLAKLAGVDKCPDAQIALAKAKTGRAELASPSCPLNSRIGGVLGGAGVGSQLTYVSGSIYLSGPFAGAPLSVVAIVPAVAGPFDVGTVVVREALTVDPRTGQASVDGSRSDPIPHILAGIPLSVREIQVHVDRSSFTLNPTSCDPFATKASIWGGGQNVFSIADDSPVARAARYQAANCSRLDFRPRLSFRLRGGTRRGAHPALHAVLRPRSGDANVAAAVVRLPRSAFLDQAHIRTICTRVQYAAKSCPPGSIYGHVRAFTPLLSEPLEGPVYLRSSNHNLPDLVFSLHGLVDFEAAGRIDSKKGGIRVTFKGIPDAPLSKVLVDMEGGRKGVVVNSTNLCGQRHRANALFDAQNGKQLTLRPAMRAAGCSKHTRGRS